MKYNEWRKNTINKLQQYFFNESHQYVTQQFNILILYIYGKHDLLLTEDEFTKKKDRAEEIIEDIIIRHKPIAYICKQIPFMGLMLYVEPPVLIPRPETEFLMEWLISYCSKNNIIPHKILDLFSGSGCMGLSLIQKFTSSMCDAVDIKEYACNNALKNSIINGVHDRYKILCEDALNFVSSCNELYDIILANPPYIDKHEYELLEKNVLLWEDKDALTDNDNGCKFLRFLLKHGIKKLNNTGIMLIETCQSNIDILLQESETKKIINSCTIIYDQYSKMRGLLVKAST